jgi:hypothetical protein
MHELSKVIPDVKVLLALTPEELGGKILFLLKKRSDREIILLANHLLRIVDARVKARS